MIDEILLTDAERRWCLEGAEERCIRRATEGNSVMQYDGTGAVDAHAFGDEGTLVVAKFYGLDREQIRTPQLQAPDLLLPDGRTVEVKRVRQQFHRLALHSHRGSDCSDDFYVLTGPGSTSSHIAIMGWITGEEFAEKGESITLKVGVQWVLPSNRMLHPSSERPW